MQTSDKDFLFALRDSIDRGELESLAGYLSSRTGRQVAYSSLKVAINPRCDNHDFKANWLPGTMDYTGNLDPLHALAKIFDHLCIPIPETPACASITIMGARSTREAGEMITRHTEHEREESDGGARVTRKEWAERAELSYQALLTIAAYWRHCQSKAENS